MTLWHIRQQLAVYKQADSEVQGLSQKLMRLQTPFMVSMKNGSLPLCWMPLVSVEVILRHTLLVLMAIRATDTPLGSLNLRGTYGYLIGYFKLLYTCVSHIQENWRGYEPELLMFYNRKVLKNTWWIVGLPALNPACYSVSMWENSCSKTYFIIFSYSQIKLINTRSPQMIKLTEVERIHHS